MLFSVQRSFKARGIAKHPTVHVGKKGAAARGRTGLNSRLRTLNVQVLVLEEQMGRLIPHEGTAGREDAGNS